MDRCPFFATNRLSTQRSPMNSSRQQQPKKVVDVPYCTHTNSPAPKDIVLGVIGGGTILKCGGDFSKCPLEN